MVEGRPRATEEMPRILEGRPRAAEEQGGKRGGQENRERGCIRLFQPAIGSKAFYPIWIR